jgi:tetrapyrrole methylase family protein/MazG family protein
MQQLIDELDRRFGVRPADGLQILSAETMARLPFDPGIPVLVVPNTDGHAALGGAVLAGRQAHGADPAELLRALYPADHQIRGLDGAADLRLGDVTADELRVGAHFLPALIGEANAASPNGLPWLVARLRAPDGCPWDREQTHRSLAKFVLEEAYEVYDALEQGSTPALAEELGDLLLQVVLHAQYAAEDGVFDMTDVYRQVMTKIVRRHPHVFGDVVAASAAEVIRNWEMIKATERAEAGEVAPDAAMPAAFAGLSRTLPALAYAQEMQERAASLGYDWAEVTGVLEKIVEEAGELSRATDEHQQREELGDLLLVIVNLGRRLGVDAESALRAASAKFARRFASVERMAAEQGADLRSLTIEELDLMWKSAKSSPSPPISAGAPKQG